WPGNIRELKNVLEQAAISCEGVIHPAELILKQSVLEGGSLTHSAKISMSLEEMERAYILEVLGKVNWHQGKTATFLRINRKTLMMKIRKYGLAHPRKRKAELTAEAQRSR